MIKSFIKIPLFFATCTSSIGMYEAYLPVKNPIFAKFGDDLYTAGTRGMVRGLFIPYLIIKKFPRIFIEELKSNGKV